MAHADGDDYTYPGHWMLDYIARQKTVSVPDDEPVEVRLMTAPQIEQMHHEQHSRQIAILEKQVAELMTTVGHLWAIVKKPEEGK